MKVIKLQIAIYLLVIALFIAGSLAIFWVSQGRHGQELFVISKGTASNLTGQSIEKFGFGTELLVISTVLIESELGQLVFAEKQQVKFSATDSFGLIIPTDTTYLKVTKPIFVQVGTDQIQINQAEVIIEPKQSRISILAGEVQGAKAGQSLTASAPATKTDRTNFTNSQVSQIIDLLKSVDKLPTTLADLDPPQIIITTPPKIVSSPTLVLAGQVERGSELLLGGEPVSVDNSGRFNVTIPLKSGLNKISLAAEDDWGNYETIGLDVVYLTQVPAVEQLSSDCSPAGSVSSLLCNINSYRTAHGKLAFSYSTKISEAALEYIFQRLTANNASLAGILANKQLSTNTILVEIEAEESSLALEKLLTEYKQAVESNKTTIGVGVIGNYYAFIFGS